MLTLLRYLLFAGGIVAVLPLLTVLWLLPTTPITGTGAFYEANTYDR